MRYNRKYMRKEIGICRLEPSRVLQAYNIVALQPYNLVALQSYNLTTLQRCHAAALQHLRCGGCKSLIVWGIKNARPHPYNTIFDEKGRAHQGTSHFLTCPYADNWLPKRHKTLYARAHRHTEDVKRWRESCDDPELKYYRHTFWNGVLIYDVPKKHAVPIAWKLTERGGPFPARHPLDLIEHFKAVAVKDDLVMWMMLTDAIYSTIHWHLHGFWLSVDEGMHRRLPVVVARYRLEPISVLPKLPYTQVRYFSRAAAYTRGKQ